MNNLIKSGVLAFLLASSVTAFAQDGTIYPT